MAINVHVRNANNDELNAHVIDAPDGFQNGTPGTFVHLSDILDLWLTFPVV